MSLDASRSYIIPAHSLATAFDALAEIAMKRRDPLELKVKLPDGATAVISACEPSHDADDEDSDHKIQRETSVALINDGDEFLVEYQFRVAFDNEMEKYLKQNPEPPFHFVRSKSGGRRAIFGVYLTVTLEFPYAMITFANMDSDDIDTFYLKAACDVMDFVGNCADRIATFKTVMGDSHLVMPIARPLPHSLFSDEERGDLSRIVGFVEQALKGSHPA